MNWSESVSWLRSGGILAYPTDTLWGLGCRADDAVLAERCLNLKGAVRSSVASVALTRPMLDEVAKVPESANLEQLLPGPYTLVLPLIDPGFRHLASSDQTLIGVRVPNHPELLAAIETLDAPILSTSMNRHGEQAVGSYHEAKRLANKWGVGVIDEPFSARGPSTVLKWTDEGWCLLRLGIGPWPLAV